MMKSAAGALVIAGLIFGSPSVASASPSPTVLKVTSGRLQGVRYVVVRKGDTLPALARAVGVSTATIKRANGMIGDGLYAGSRLLIEDPNPGRGEPGMSVTTTTTSPKPSTTAIYTVVRGDSLSKIAVKFGTTVKTLMTTNKLADPNKITIGQKLTVPTAPSGTTSTTTAKQLKCPVASSNFVYDWGYPRSGGRYHEGVDMMAKLGTPVLSPVSGTIAFSTNTLGGLSFNLIGDDGFRYYGAHLSKVGPKAGKVNIGDVIGYVGNSGDAAGGPTHLHFEIKPAGGKPMNPHPYVTTACKGAK